MNLEYSGFSYKDTCLRMFFEADWIVFAEILKAVTKNWEALWAVKLYCIRLRDGLESYPKFVQLIRLSVLKEGGFEGSKRDHLMFFL